MTKQEVIEELCNLSSKVARFMKNRVPADCFCGKNFLVNNSFQFDVRVIEFIQNAVNEKIERELKDGNSK